jgi:hypothetical protein
VPEGLAAATQVAARPTHSIALLADCERTAGDLDMNGQFNAADISLILMDFGPCEGCPTDLDGSGVVDLGDVAMVMVQFGPSP